MAYQTWQQLLVSQSVDGAALTASTTETSILGSGARCTLPAGFLFYEGQAMRLRAMGRVTTVTTPGTLTLRFKLGPTANIIVAAGPAFALNASAKTNVTWILDWDFVVRTIGASTAATIMHSGTWTSEAVIGSAAPAAGGAGQHMIPASAPAVGTGFDSTVANVADLTAQWGTSNANSIQCHSYKLESLN